MSKIERGEYVELEKLLAKNGNTITDESKIELVSRGGLHLCMIRSRGSLEYISGNKHFIFMLQFIQELIRKGPQRFGSMYMSLIQLHNLFTGTMCHYMIQHFNS